MFVRLSLIAALSLAVGCATTTPATGTATASESGDSCDMHRKEGKHCDCAGNAEHKDGECCKGEKKGECCKGEKKGECCKGKGHKPEGAACGCGKAHEDGQGCDGKGGEPKADCGCGSTGACGGTCTADKGCGCGGKNG